MRAVFPSGGDFKGGLSVCEHEDGSVTIVVPTVSATLRREDFLHCIRRFAADLAPPPKHQSPGASRAEGEQASKNTTPQGEES